MNATRRTPKKAAKATPRRRTSTRRTTTTRRTTRRRTPQLATTLGAALGALVIAFFTNMSWPLRLGLVAVVVVGALAYVLWSHRAEIAAAGRAAPETGADATPDPSEPTDLPPADGETP